MQHTATHCNTLQHTATHCNTLQHTATQCNTMQHTATHCNTLRHTATHCNNATHCNTLRHTATHCEKGQRLASLFDLEGLRPELFEVGRHSTLCWGFLDSDDLNERNAWLDIVHAWTYLEEGCIFENQFSLLGSTVTFLTCSLLQGEHIFDEGSCTNFLRSFGEFWSCFQGLVGTVFRIW